MNCITTPPFACSGTVNDCFEDTFLTDATFPVLNAHARLYLDAVLSVYENGASTKQMFDLVLPWLFSNFFLAGENEIPAGKLSNVTLKILNGCGHLFNYEQPETFHGAVVNFLQES